MAGPIATIAQSAWHERAKPVLQVDQAPHNFWWDYQPAFCLPNLGVLCAQLKTAAQQPQWWLAPPTTFDRWWKASCTTQWPYDCPVIVRQKSHWFVCDGHHRIAAALIASQSTVPAILGHPKGANTVIDWQADVSKKSGLFTLYDGRQFSLFRHLRGYKSDHFTPRNGWAVRAVFEGNPQIFIIASAQVRGLRSKIEGHSTRLLDGGIG
jgi:hypothetical protein